MDLEGESLLVIMSGVFVIVLRLCGVAGWWRVFASFVRRVQCVDGVCVCSRRGVCCHLTDRKLRWTKSFFF